MPKNTQVAGTRVEAEPSPSNSTLSPFSHNGAGTLFSSLVFLKSKGNWKAENKPKGLFPTSLTNDPSL